MSIYATTSNRLRVREMAVDLSDGLLAWLVQNAPGGAEWLLAHCYAGVVWGRQQGQEWILSSKLAPDLSPEMSAETVLQARIFGESGELFVWRDGPALRARKVEADAGGAPVEGYVEDQWLWGTRDDSGDAARDEAIRAAGFTLLADGDQGLRHCVPITVPADHFTDKMDNYRPVRLRAEHYLQRDDETGMAYVWLSRLVKIYSEPLAQEA